MVAGPQYPPAIDWPANVERLEHVPPAEHPAFYAASLLGFTGLVYLLRAVVRG